MADSPSLRIALFCHSIVSDWNHGNAHFLRGLIRALQQMGHRVVSLEEEGNWSLSNLVRDHGEGPIREFERRFSYVEHQGYLLNGRTRLMGWLEDLLGQVDVCLVHEWNPNDLVRAVGQTAARLGVVSLFHDTHHRSLTEPDRVRELGLDAYSAVLAYGPTIAEIYRAKTSGPEVVVFHEGADVEIFRPLNRTRDSDVVFVGNWGDEDRNQATRDFFIHPCRELPELSFDLFGVRYPAPVVDELRQAGVNWRGWLPNYLAPEAYAASRLTIHIPRREYVEALHGTPTIRVFEALACGIPLISAGWRDRAGLFEEGADYVAVDTPSQMVEAVRWLARDDSARQALADRGRETIIREHTCRHRAEQLIDLIGRIRDRGRIDRSLELA